MDTPPFTRVVSALPTSVPFVGPDQIERESGVPFRARLGANENVLGPSPRAIAAIGAVAGEAWKYGDPLAHDLRTALGDHHGIPIDAIVAGQGIDGLLGRAEADHQGAEILQFQPQQGADPHVVIHDGHGAGRTGTGIGVSHAHHPLAA